MILLKSATILCLCSLTRAATVKHRNIPVEIKFDEANEKSQNEINEASSEVIRSSLENQQDAVRNLDEKVQLSPEDLNQTLKHLHSAADISLKELGVHPEQITVETDDRGILQQAEDIIRSGLKKLRTSFTADHDQKTPNSQQWDDLEKAVNTYLNEQKIKLQLKQEQPAQPPQNQNFFQNIAQGFQTIANNFIQNLVTPQNTNGNSTSQGDEQQGEQAQGPFQGFINFFQNGVNNLVGSINGLGGQGSTTSNTVLGDTGSATTQAPGLVSNFVNNVQQFFGQIQGAGQGGSSGATQGDTGNGTSPSFPQRPGEIIQSIGSAINQFIQGRPPNTSGDEGTGTTEANVNIIQSIGNVIQNSPLNPFRPPQKPADGVAGASTSNPIQAGVENIGNQIQQLIPGQGISTDAPKVQDEVVSNQSDTNVAEVSKSQTAREQQKEIVLDLGVTNEQPIEDTTQTEPQEDTSQETMEKENQVQEEAKGEQVEQQMEEQTKKEEMKEELREEQIRDEVEHEKKETEGKMEILVAAE